MIERPILFSPPMVLATMDGNKTQTRRIIKSEIALDWLDNAKFNPEFVAHPENDMCKYGKIGDRLWVRETWKYNNWTEDGIPFIEYRADGSVLLREHPEEWADRVENIWAELSDPQNYEIDNAARDRKFRPSIHMPRWVSRTNLEITNIRAERLNDISEADAKAEGINCYQFFPDDGFPICSGYTHLPDDGNCGLYSTAKEAFKNLWEIINGESSWDQNPWVWVIDFKRI